MSRRITGAVVALLAALALVLGLAPATQAATGPTFTVMNTSEAPPDGVYFRSATNMASAVVINGFGVYKNERVQASCYTMGEAVGDVYHNKVWYYAYNVSRPSVAGRSNEGWINTHFVNDGMPADHAAPGIPACGSPSPHVTPCVMNMRWNKLNLTVDYGGDHRYYGNAWQAVQNWNNQHTGITLSIAKGSTGANISFVDVWAKPSDVWASAQIQKVGGVNLRGTTSISPNPVHPSHVDIWANQFKMDGLDDAHRTYALTHELGHALGLAHTNDCGITSPSIMAAGDANVPTRTLITIQAYDRIELEELYGLPTG